MAKEISLEIEGKVSVIEREDGEEISREDIDNHVVLAILEKFIIQAIETQLEKEGASDDVC